MNENKTKATQFLELVVAGQIDEAYAAYIDMHGKHHDVHFAAGFEAHRRDMKENHQQFPHKQMSIKHVLADGDFVSVHSHIIPKSGERGVIAVHMFRFADGKITEMWTVSNPIPGDSPNSDGPF